MSFRRREKTNSSTQPLPKGVRPSAANGIPVTSSGCISLDTVLSGHGGIPIGSGILIEENGTTDFAAVLLRYYAAEGLLQGQHLWVGGGNGEAWVKDLPAATDSVSEAETKLSEERMKIAWRYSGMGEFGSGLRYGPQRPNTTSSPTPEDKAHDPYCHAFDLTKRAVLTSSRGQIVHSPPAALSGDPYGPILASLVQTINQTSGIVRCVLPNLLSPALYPPSASNGKYLVRFINHLRLVLRAHASRLLLMLSLPLDLYPRAGATTTWVELLLDGVIELVPLPPPAASTTTTSTSTEGERRDTAGLVRIHKVPALDRPRSGTIESDLSFKVTRKRFTIEAWSLPALHDDEPREGGGTLKNVTKQTTVDVSF